MYLLRVLIGSLDCLGLLWLARVSTLVLVLRHSVENLSIRAVFNWVSKIITQLLWFCIATVCDWLKNLAPRSQPIRSKTKTNRDLPARVSRAWRRMHVFASSSDWFTGLFTTVVIGQSNKVLNIENRSMLKVTQIWNTSFIFLSFSYEWFSLLLFAYLKHSETFGLFIVFRAC